MKKRIWLIIAVLALATFQIAMQLYLAKVDSQTTDEGTHLSAGYTYLIKREVRFNPEHPPLVKALAALPLLAVHPQIKKFDELWNKAGNFFYDSVNENYQLGSSLLYESGNDGNRLLFLGRLPIIGLAVILGLLIFWLAYRWWGPAGGLFSYALFIFDPNLTAHSHLVTTDIGAALGFLIFLLTAWLFLHQNGWPKTVLLGATLGVALLCKFTLVIAIPVFILLLIWRIFRIRPGWRWVGTTIGKAIVAGLVAWIVIWAGYGFSVTKAPAINGNVINTIRGITNRPADYPSGSKSSLIDHSYNAARYVLIPRVFFKGLVYVLIHVGNGHSSFLLGQTSATGWWYYFPVVFLFKTPLATLTILALLLGLVISRRAPPETTEKLQFLLLAAGGYFLAAMTSKADLGLRHIFPVFPPLFIAFGYLMTQGKRLRWLCGILLVILIIEFVSAFPYYLSFFNTAAGGAWRGYKIAGDSNLEWGQDLKRIKTYEDKHPEIGTPYLSYSWDGEAALKYLGIKYLPLEAPYDQSQYIIIGAGDRISPRFNWLINQPIYDQITPAVFIYKFGPEAAPRHE